MSRADHLDRLSVAAAHAPDVKEIDQRVCGWLTDLAAAAAAVGYREALRDLLSHFNARIAASKNHLTDLHAVAMIEQLAAARGIDLTEGGAK